MKICVCLLVAVVAAETIASRTEDTAKYMVVDLVPAKGSRKFAVSYLADVPEGGWTDEYKTTKLVLRRVGPQTFRMGRTDDEKALGRSPMHEFVHDVTLTRPYWFAIFETTQRQWELVMGRNPSVLSRHACSPLRPADSVSYHLLRGKTRGTEWPASRDVDPGSFIYQLRAKTGLAGFDIPTSAQWECAARAGSRTMFLDGKTYPAEEADKAMARFGRCHENCSCGSPQRCEGDYRAADERSFTAPVGSYEPNLWGIYDVGGNVYEWCRDYSSDFLAISPDGETDPVGPLAPQFSEFGVSRVVRGSSYLFPARLLTPSTALRAAEGESGEMYGSRLVYEEGWEDAVPPPPERTNAVFAATGDVRLSLTLKDAQRAVLDFAYAGTSATERVTFDPGDQDDLSPWFAYRYRRQGAQFTQHSSYRRAKVRIGSAPKAKWFGFDYTLLPYFDGWNGVYDHETVQANIQDWQANFPRLEDKVFELTFRYCPKKDRMTAWLDGSYAGTASLPGRFSSVRVETGAAAVVKCEPLAPPCVEPGRLELSPQPNLLRVHPLLRRGATLSVPTGENVLNGIPMNVWKPEESFDQGLHHETCHRDDIMQLGPLGRTAFANGPEYLQWSVPRDFWCEAWVLCAAVPGGANPAGRKETRSVVGTELGRYAGGDGNTGWLVNDRTELPVRPDYASLTNADRRIVGKLSYRKPDGRPAEAFLWLVRHRLDCGELLSQIDDRAIHLSRSLKQVDDYLDFGFVGGGTWNGSVRSDVQIFGCTLVAAPLAMSVVPRVPGNVFAGGEKPVTGVELTAARDNARGSLTWTIRDTDYKVLKAGEVPVALLRAGETRHVDLDLTMPELGWYALDLTLLGDDGRELYTHEAAFALLGEDTREAGFESPYGAWPQQLGYSPELEKKRPETKGFGGGRHNCNPSREQVLALLHKAGFHKGVHEIVKDEGEFPDYRYTLTEWGARNAMVRMPCSDEALQRKFDADVNEFRALRARYPHLDTIYICHENEPRGLSAEVRGEMPVVRRPMPAREERFDIYALREYCRRMHREFPGVKLRYANNSAAGERVARLARLGFDLNELDELGSEVRGFQSLPEAAADLEAPGSIWALRETGRLYGMTNAAVGASFEYVFRPERRVNRADPDNLRQTNYAVRDYLLTLGFGCRTVSSGHLEDCNSGYYDTDWGASGLCRAYPTSYPKRMFVALATFTRVFDRPRFSRCLSTGRHAAYALEFRRERKTPDWVCAFWTADFGAKLSVSLPSGANARLVTAFGAERPFNADRSIDVGATPVYLITDRPVESVRVTEDLPGPGAALAAKGRKIVNVADDARFSVVSADAPGVPNAVLGRFDNRIVEDPVHGKVLEATLRTEVPSVSKVLSEYEFLRFRQPAQLPMGREPRLGVWVKGNGSFGRIGFVFRRYKGDSQRGETRVVYPGNDGYVDFTGWQFLVADRTNADARESFEGFRFEGLVVGSARTALDPLEMREVKEPVCVGAVLSVVPPAVPRDDSAAWSNQRLRGDLGDWL